MKPSRSNHPSTRPLVQAFASLVTTVGLASAIQLCRQLVFAQENLDGLELPLLLLISATAYLGLLTYRVWTNLSTTTIRRVCHTLAFLLWAWFPTHKLCSALWPHLAGIEGLDAGRMSTFCKMVVVLSIVCFGDWLTRRLNALLFEEAGSTGTPTQ